MCTSGWSWKTYIDEAREVSLPQVVQHRGLVEAGQVRHVLHFAEARRVHPLHLLSGQCDPTLAVRQLHIHLIAALLPDAGRLWVEGKTCMVHSGEMLWRETAVISKPKTQS